MKTKHKSGAPAKGCTVRLFCRGSSAPWATVEFDPDLTAAIYARAASDGVTFKTAFKALLRAFFAREGKEVA